MLELIDVSYSYPGGFPALSSVNLAIRPGEKVAILGANGAGKTTLLNILNGSVQPDEGTLRLDGERVRQNRDGLRNLRQAVGLVLQDPDDQLFAASVYEDVSFGPLNQGLAESEVHVRVEAALSAMQIAGLGDRPTHMLSFGQKKRAAIAGVLAMRPKFLLLDEPTAGLDPVGVAHLMDALRDISSRGTAIALATHDMDVAYGWAERILIFAGGHIAASGTPDDVFADTALLARLQLEAPVIWEIAHAFRQHQVTGTQAAMPRNRAELLSEIRRFIRAETLPAR